jgi:hypothetical protein
MRVRAYTRFAISCVAVREVESFERLAATNPSLASYLRIEERELEASGVN